MVSWIEVGDFVLKNGEDGYEGLLELVAVELAGLEGRGLSHFKAFEEAHQYSIRLYYAMIKLPDLSGNTRINIMPCYRNMIN